MADFDGEYLGGTTEAYGNDAPSGAVAAEYLAGITDAYGNDASAGAHAAELLELGNCSPPVSFIPLSQRKIFGNHGGDILRLTGTFPIGVPVAVSIGPVGGPYLYPAYGGSGYGYAPRSADGVSLPVVLPPVPFVGDFAIRVVVPPSVELIVQAGTFVERAWYGKVHVMRSSFPPQAETGPRRLDAEPPLVS